MSRLASLSQDLGGSAYDFTHSFSYNPAGQIASVTRSNDTYAWNGHYNADRNYAVNGLNQATAAGATGLGYDGRGNLTSSGSSTYSYTSENRLATAPGGYVMTYDPLGRYHWISGGGPITWMQYDGGNLIEERDGNGVLRRYVPGPGVDEPIIWYEGSGTSDRRWLHADERGSVVAVTDGSGNAIAINRYDEYGVPASTNIGRFQYTGQAWMPELGMYYYKARMYSPTLGRFMQTDPIGYGDGMNLYNYVGGDPVNSTDPSGLSETYTCDARGRCKNSAGKRIDPRTTGLQPGDTVNSGGGTYTHGSGPSGNGSNSSATIFDFGGDSSSSYGPDDIVSSCNSVCRANIVERDNEFRRDTNDRWVLMGGQYELNPYYERPWYDPGLQTFVVIPVAAAAIVTVIVTGPVAAGAEVSLGKNVRIAPFGNRTGHRLGEFPHYHRRGIGPTGETAPGQGIGRHRPWENKSTDTSFWDRF